MPLEPPKLDLSGLALTLEGVVSPDFSAADFAEYATQLLWSWLLLKWDHDSIEGAYILRRSCPGYGAFSDGEVDALLEMFSSSDEVPSILGGRSIPVKVVDSIANGSPSQPFTYTCGAGGGLSEPYIAATMGATVGA